MKIGTWNVRSPYRARSLKAAVRELARYKLDVMAVQEVMWDKGGTWSLTLREGRKLRMFENMVLRRIFGPGRDEITGDWRRLHNEELNDLYS